jgi:8-oxo-dGTP diphosphatase
MNYIYDYPRYKVTANVICVDKSSFGSVLLITRGIDPYKGWFAFPGGNLEPNESIVECAVRELREETGIIVDQDNLELLTILDDVHDNNEYERSIAMFYVADYFSTEICAGDDACSAMWVPFSEIYRYGKIVNPLAFNHGLLLPNIAEILNVN